ncbi:MAG: hypothetical protein PHQ50_02840 [Eubacteriales bacterium]|nr:hypothetical protein [Eubacteriales bacterium]MDD3349254.1 hypothetical protein [Eubacteriales bacterium]
MNKTDERNDLHNAQREFLTQKLKFGILGRLHADDALSEQDFLTILNERKKTNRE